MAKLDDQEYVDKTHWKKKMCKFWFYIVAKLDHQDDMDRWFYHPVWKKIKVLILNSGQVGPPGRCGQVIFSPSLKKKKMCKFIFFSGKVGLPGDSEKNEKT